MVIERNPAAVELDRLGEGGAGQVDDLRSHELLGEGGKRRGAVQSTLRWRLPKGEAACGPRETAALQLVGAYRRAHARHRHICLPVQSQAARAQGREQAGGDSTRLPVFEKTTAALAAEESLEKEAKKNGAPEVAELYLSPCSYEYVLCERGVGHL